MSASVKPPTDRFQIHQIFIKLQSGTPERGKQTRKNLGVSGEWIGKKPDVMVLVKQGGKNNGERC